MADVRIPSSLPTVATPAPVRSTEAVRAAQRAFFDTALANADAPVTARSVAPAAQIAPAVVPLRAVTPPAPDVGGQPMRALRPGSLLDIRI